MNERSSLLRQLDLIKKYIDPELNKYSRLTPQIAQANEEN
jgi:hypothetical protein